MVQIGFRTDPGKVRSVNEDALFVMPKQNIYVVADGVGGHNAGEMASRTAVGSIAAYIQSNPIERAWTEAEIVEYLARCLSEVNISVYRMAKDQEAYRGMATTAVLLYVAGKKAYIANIGDSRAYLIRNGIITQLTEDHTIVSQLLKEGSITKQEALAHPMNNMITRALGGEAVVRPDFFSVDIEKKDIFLLCTDGLYGEVAEERIMEVLNGEKSMHKACAELVRLANDNEGKDNITAVCVRI